MPLPTRTLSVLDHIAIGDKARTMRKKAGKSLRFVALKMKVSAPYLSDLERGRTNWNEKRFEQFRKALNSK